MSKLQDLITILSTLFCNTQHHSILRSPSRSTNEFVRTGEKEKSTALNKYDKNLVDQLKAEERNSRIQRNISRKRKRAKGPNPLSIKKPKIKQDDVKATETPLENNVEQSSVTKKEIVSTTLEETAPIPESIDKPRKKRKRYKNKNKSPAKTPGTGSPESICKLNIEQLSKDTEKQIQHELIPSTNKNHNKKRKQKDTPETLNTATSDKTKDSSSSVSIAVEKLVQKEISIENVKPVMKKANNHKDDNYPNVKLNVNIKDTNKDLTNETSHRDILANQKKNGSEHITNLSHSEYTNEAPGNSITPANETNETKEKDKTEGESNRENDDKNEHENSITTKRKHRRNRRRRGKRDEAEINATSNQDIRDPVTTSCS